MQVLFLFVLISRGTFQRALAFYAVRVWLLSYGILRDIKTEQNMGPSVDRIHSEFRNFPELPPGKASMINEGDDDGTSSASLLAPPPPRPRSPTLPVYLSYYCAIVQDNKLQLVVYLPVEA